MTASMNILIFGRKSDVKQKTTYIFVCKWLIFCLPARIRTWDPLIKSQLLYQLSYGEVVNYIFGLQKYKK